MLTRSRLFAGRLFAGRLFGPAERAEYYGGISEDELIARILADWPQDVPITDERAQRVFDAAQERQLAPTEPEPPPITIIARPGARPVVATRPAQTKPRQATPQTQRSKVPPESVLPDLAEQIRAAYARDDEEALVFILANL